ncbi:MAG: tetratricopeptide repeat protein [Bryobacteraceae bacterium]
MTFHDPHDEVREQAWRLYDKGDLAGALALWRQIARGCPEAEDLCSLALTARRLGEVEEAEAALLKAVTIDPSLRLAHVMLCRNAVGNGSWADAEFRARRALDLEEDGDVYDLLGLTLDALDRYDEAHAAFSRGIEIDPTYEDLYSDFGQLVRKRDPVEAERLFRKAIELEPAYAEAHRELGSLLLHQEAAVFRQKLLDEAEHHLRLAIELDPGDTWARLYLGNLHYTRNDPRAALVELRLAHESAPSWAVTMWCLADCHAELEEWAKAEELYLRALAAEPDSIHANRALARMYMLQGRTELAQTYFGRVLLLNPEDKGAREGMERTEDGAGVPKHVARRVHRRQSRWQRRRDPDSV